MADQMSEPVKTFSIGFPDAAFNETSYARVVAERFSTDHHEFEVQPHDVSILRKIALHYGEPYSDSSAIPSFYLSELAGQHVTVALNGDGSDESFAGYEAKYGAMERVAERFDRIPDPVRSAAAWAGRRLGEGAHSQTLRSRLSRRAQILGLPYEQRYARWSRTFAPGERARLLTPEFQRLAGDHDLVLDAWRKARASERVDRMLEVDVETYLPGDLLVKMDIATMAYSVEGRSPFLDHRLMEFAAALPVEQKLAAGQTKRILKSAMRGLLPDEIIDRPKMGFSVPLARWFRQDLKSLPEEILLDPRSLGRGYFVPAEVRRLLREHQSGQVDHWPRIWTLMQLEMWHRVVVEGE
jgi:asparagine synthase (glutamine-hydrolysing)